MWTVWSENETWHRSMGPQGTKGLSTDNGQAEQSEECMMDYLHQRKAHDQESQQDLGSIRSTTKGKNKMIHNRAMLPSILALVKKDNRSSE